MPDSIGQLKQCQTLSLSSVALSCGVVGGKLSTLPDSIGQLRNLRKLKITAYPHLTFPESFWQLNQLEELEISFLYMNRLPENIGQLTGLKKLVVSGNPNITTLPESIGQLDNLQELHIVSCQKFSAIPENLARLKNLKRFYIAACENLKNVPQSIQALSALTCFEDYWDWYLLYREKEAKKNKTPKAKPPMLTREQKQAKKVLRKLKEDTAIPAISIKIKKKKNLPLTASKFGGVPYWQPETPYPVDNQGNKMLLLAQLDCRESVSNLEAFPMTGLLQFFISSDDLAGLDCENPISQKGHRVVYHEKIDENITKEQVLGLNIPNSTMFIEDSGLPFFECEYQLVFHLSSYSITPLDFRFEKRFRETAKSMGIDFDTQTEIDALIDDDDYDKLCQSTTGHHCGGYPYFTQDDPRQEYPQHTVLLLQIDSEKDISWGDAGVGHFFITLDDLKKRDFSRVLYYWDCH